MSGIADIFSQKAEKDTKREIVLELLDSDKNLDEKTELKKPMRWACLKTVENFIDSQKLPKSAGIISSFITQSHKYLISKDRKGRGEYIEALKSLSNMEKTEEKSETTKLLEA